jgi:hypothetical protein
LLEAWAKDYLLSSKSSCEQNRKIYRPRLISRRRLRAQCLQYRGDENGRILRELSIMKICFLGSRNLSIAEEALLNNFSYRKKTFYFDDGVLSFLKSINEDILFHDAVKGSDYIFIDLFSDKNSSRKRYDILTFYYQKLVWFLRSITPHSQIIIFNFLKEPSSDFSFSRFLSDLEIKNASVIESPNFNDKYSANGDFIQSVMAEIFKTTPKNKETSTEEDPFSEIVKKLKNKKEFETIVKNV